MPERSNWSASQTVQRCQNFPSPQPPMLRKYCSQKTQNYHKTDAYSNSHAMPKLSNCLVSKTVTRVHFNCSHIFQILWLPVCSYVWLKNKMGSATSRSNTHVPNATGKPLRVFYKVGTMTLDEVVTKGEVSGGYKATSGVSSSPDSPVNANNDISTSISSDGTSRFKPDCRVRFIRVPIGKWLKIVGEGKLYVSMFVEENETSCTCVCANFLIPSDRYFIVASDRSILFQKYGACQWIDESSHNHKPLLENQSIHCSTGNKI